MDQKPTTSISVPPIAVTCKILTSQVTSTIVSASTSNSYILTPSNLRPVQNYTLIPSSQVPNTHRYVVQSNIRPTVPQYISTGNVRHILSPNTQPSKVTYMLPSGAQIIRMNSTAGVQSSNTQYILKSSSQKLNPNNVLQLGTQSPKTSPKINSDSKVVMPRNIGVTTPTPTIQTTGINVPKLNAAYLSRIKTNEPQKISIISPKLNDQKPGTNLILISNDSSRNKQIPISSLQKLNKNYKQIPLIQKADTVLSTNTLKSNVELQKAQPIRSVNLPSNSQTAQVSPKQGTDNKIVLNSINVPIKVLNSNHSRLSISSTPVSNIQQLNTNYMNIPVVRKPVQAVLKNCKIQPNIGKNINNGQNQTIRSVLLPSTCQKTMISSPQNSSDYRLFLKPVNIQSQMLRMPQPRFPSPQHTSVRKVKPRNISHPVRPILHPVRPISRPVRPIPHHPVRTILHHPVRPIRHHPVRPIQHLNRVPMTLPSKSRIHNVVIADSKITPISLRERKSQLIISEKSIRICIDELNRKKNVKERFLNLTESATKLVQTEVTYRLFYLLRECKKVLIRTRSNVLTETCVRQVCSEYFATFYGNKLWPLFCLKQSNDANSVWMRKHNNVNLVAWLKHPKFRDPSYIKKRRRINVKNYNLPLSQLTRVSEVVYEYPKPIQINEESIESPQTSTIFYQSLKKNQIPFNEILTKDNHNNNNTDKSTSKLSSFLDIPQANIKNIKNILTIIK